MNKRVSFTVMMLCILLFTGCRSFRNAFETFCSQKESSSPSCPARRNRR